MTSTRIGPSVAMIDASIGPGMLDADHQEQFFGDPHQRGRRDQFQDILPADRLDRHEKHRTESQQRRDAYDQHRHRVRRYVMRHDNLIQRIVDGPDHIRQDQAQMGFDDVAHTAHGIKRLHRSACKKRASRRRSRQEAGRIRQRVGRFVRATTDCFRHEADHVPLTRGRRRSLCDKGKGRHLTDNFHNPSKALPFQIRFGQARRTSLQPKAMAIINFFITRS